MSVEITGYGGWAIFEFDEWRMVLDRALQFGWNPAGSSRGRKDLFVQAANVEELKEAVRHLELQLKGGYLHNRHQVVSAADARALAAALGRAIAAETKGSPEDPFSIDQENPELKIMRAAARVCEAGGFEIH